MREHYMWNWKIRPRCSARFEGKRRCIFNAGHDDDHRNGETEWHNPHGEWIAKAIAAAKAQGIEEGVAIAMVGVDRAIARTKAECADPSVHDYCGKGVCALNGGHLGRCRA